MEQLDVFNLEDLKKPLPSEDEIALMAMNRLVLNLHPRSKDADANVAAKLILQATGKLVDKKQVDHTIHAPKDLNDFYNEQ